MAGKVLTILVNHLKAQDGKDASEKRRREQAERVAAIAQGVADSGRSPIVVGDLNVPPDKGTSLEPLLKCALLADPFAGVADDWTHYYESKREVSRLDYILPAKNLKVVGQSVFRKGLSKKCKQHQGDRFPTIGMAHTEASDHCPVTVAIEVE